MVVVTSGRSLALSYPEDEAPEKKDTMMATIYPEVSCGGRYEYW